MAYKISSAECAKKYNSVDSGLNQEQVTSSIKNYGTNTITQKRGKSFIRKVLDALCDPMIIILEFALIITLGINIGKQIKGGNGDFFECSA